MPAATFYQPMESILNGKCAYEYYNQTQKTYSKAVKSRICKVSLNNEDDFNDTVLLMIFTIRNQPSANKEYVWKIHSEGPKRTDPGATVPLRNTAELLAMKNKWKYMSVAVAAEDVPESEIVSKYIISMESYLYGNDTVYDLTDDLKRLEELNTPRFYRCEANVNGTKYTLSFIRKDCFVDYLCFFDNRAYSDIRENRKLRELDYPAAVDINAKLKTGDNVLLYGVPGCGKSHTIKTDYCNDQRFMERVVFHPDYTYSDFVGQILPNNEGGHISYPFVPGPFTRILAKAYADPDRNYFLVIEELNRGNAPAIFGEIFQLLDRDSSGASEYEINNTDIAQIVYDEAFHPVKIPGNLFILATMNTADQNVFTLDTAFKRRWRMKNIPNNIDECGFAADSICGSRVSWKSFVDTVNKLIIEAGEGNIGSEDKRLGAYFVNQEELANIDQFSEKVLMYLWNDAFKYDHEKVFKQHYNTLEQLIDGFKDNLFDIFADTVRFEPLIDETAITSKSVSCENYLAGQSEISRDLFNTIVNALNDAGMTYTISATQYYLTMKTPTNRVAAEFHLQKKQVQIITKEPTDVTLRSFGDKLPETYRWTKDFRTYFDKDSDITTIVGIIADSYNQVMGEKDA